MIMFFTLQASDSSRDLSKAVRSWLRCFGVDVVFKRLQRNTDYCRRDKARDSDNIRYETNTGAGKP